jgi:ABC-2 type transport system permease protein
MMCSYRLPANKSEKLMPGRRNKMSAKLEFTQKPAGIQAISESLIMIGRSTRHIIRNRDQLLGAFFQPIMFLVLFAAVFGGSISKALPPDVSYFLLAGIIVQTVAFGSTTTAIAVTNDMQKGIMDRFRSLPMSNLSVLTGHAVSDLFRNAISTSVMLIVGFMMGFRSSASLMDWATIVAILILFTLAFSWLSATVGAMAKSVEGVQWITFVLIFPLTFASSAFTPTDDMGKYLKMFAENQPITRVIDAVRGLMLGNPNSDDILWAFIWCFILIVVAIPLAAWMFKRRTAN